MATLQQKLVCRNYCPEVSVHERFHSRKPLLIQSRHDGLISYSCAERFYEKAQALGNPCELYSVTDRRNTHSWYTAGMFLETRETNQGLNKFFSWIEQIEKDVHA